MAPDLLVLVKHARPEVDPTRPAASWTLGPEGVAGAGRLAERLRPLSMDLFDEPSRVVFGAESADAAFTRFSGAVDALGRVHRGRRLCIVAHGTVISLLLSRRYGVEAWPTWKALETPSYVVVDRRTKTVVDVVLQV